MLCRYSGTGTAVRLKSKALVSNAGAEVKAAAEQEAVGVLQAVVESVLLVLGSEGVVQRALERVRAVEPEKVERSFAILSLSPRKRGLPPHGPVRVRRM
jgi:hypothetical protein